MWGVSLAYDFEKQKYWSQIYKAKNDMKLYRRFLL